MTHPTKSRLLPEMPSLFSGFFDDDRIMNWNLANKLGFTHTPAANIIEKENEFLIDLAAPGLQKEDFHLDLENGNLRIYAKKEEENKEEEKDYTKHEYSFNSFSRTFELPDLINLDKIEAQYENGVLKITLPKKPEATKAQKKQIKIK